MIQSKPRSGATLTEVLVAIFVMAIGLLALLTLFPLGALSMAQAIKDDRTAHSAKNAYGIAQSYFNANLVVSGIQPGIQNDVFLTNNATFLAPPIAPAGALYTGAPPAIPANSPSYFLNPYPGIQQQGVAPPGLFLAPDLKSIPNYDGTSYPIYVDPWGWNALRSSPTAIVNNPNGVPVPYWVVGNAPPPVAANPPGQMIYYSSIPRVPLSALLSMNANQWLDRWCTLSDDITFQESATPSLSSGTVQRENRYSWAWLVRLPNVNDSSTVDVSIVVYSGRSLTSLGEFSYPSVIFGATDSFVDVPYPAGARPQIRTGTWVLDATMEYQDPVTLQNVPDPHGYFYRVVGITDIAMPSSPYPNMQGLRLEIQGTFKNKTPTATSTGQPYGVLVVMENVAEVF
jgi:hypothetical protein